MRLGTRLRALPLVTLLLLAACTGESPGAGVPDGAAATGLADTAEGVVDGGPQDSLIRAVRSRGELRAGVAPADPFVYKDPETDEWRGVFVDLLDDWATGVLDVELVTVETSWATMIAGLQAGQYDIAVDLNPTSERSLAVQFTEGVLVGVSNFLVDPDRTAAGSFEELNTSDHTICAIQGTVLDSSLQALEPEATLQLLPDRDACIQSLLSGRVDAFHGDWKITARLVEEFPHLGVIFPETPIVFQPEAYGIPLGYPHSDLAALNIFIDEWKASPRGLVAAMREHAPDLDPLAPAVGDVPEWVHDAAVVYGR